MDRQHFQPAADMTVTATTTIPPATTKSRAPQYPRAVSPVCVDELPLSRSTVVYGESSHFRTNSPGLESKTRTVGSLQSGRNKREQDDLRNEKEESQKRAGKRRRIGEFAASYLRGESVFILSAGLKGGFGPEWKNPWRREKVEIKCTEEIPEEKEAIPETARRFKSGLRRLRVREMREELISLREQADPDSPVKRWAQQVQITTARAGEKTPPPDQEPEQQFHVQGDHTLDAAVLQPNVYKSLDRQVEDWLKNNNQAFDLPSSEEPTHTPSPTYSNVKPGRSKQEHPHTPLNTEKVEDSRFAELSNRALQGSSPPHVDLGDVEIEEPVLTRPSAETFQTAPASPSKVGDSMEVTEEQPFQGQVSPNKRLINEVAKAASVRGERAQKRFRRRSLHTASPSAHLQSFEYRRVDAVETAPQRNSERSNTAEHHLTQPHLQIDTGSELSESRKESTSAKPNGGVLLGNQASAQPHLSRETSKGSINNLQSAQLQQPMPLQASLARLASSEQVLPEIESDAQPDHPTESHILPTDEPQALLGQHGLQLPLAHDIVDAVGEVTAETPSAPAEKPAPELDTQQMLAAISPLDFSTVKKPASKLMNLQTPVTASKVQKTSKQNKKAPTAKDKSGSDTSQGSIRAGFKQSKFHQQPFDKLVGNKSLSIHNLLPDDKDRDSNQGLEGRESNTNNASSPSSESLPSITSLLSPTHRQDNEVHAHRNFTSTATHPLTNSSAIPHSSKPCTMPSGKHDAQLEVHQLHAPTLPPPSDTLGQDHIQVLEDPFDLEGAMDEFGEYLGSQVWDADLEAASFLTSPAR